jgi:hypothetical protein
MDFGKGKPIFCPFNSSCLNNSETKYSINNGLVVEIFLFHVVGNPSHASIFDTAVWCDPSVTLELSCSCIQSDIIQVCVLSWRSARNINYNFYVRCTIVYRYFVNCWQLPGHLQVRLQTVENWKPPSTSKDQHSFNILLTWLKRIQFKLGQVEVQSSAATQFYSVWTV